ncbi:hypothetical protein [Bradyrhizobium sp. McL0616]|uniref:hypothetical protein n=1 Tax=Bradyrhizobium sp. McL0616 TaxID=3415674 RepID=UPI003CF44A2C
MSFVPSTTDLRFALTHEGDPVGSWDPARLRLVLSNLFGNAIQHGDLSSPVTVNVSGNDRGSYNGAQPWHTNPA